MAAIDPPRTAGRPVAVVTGASAGVGRATAIEFARRGWRVALLARGTAGLQAASRDVEAAGGAALIVAVDVADPRAVDAAADRVVGTWGRLDAWVNDAMVTVFGPADRIAPDEWRRVTDVTYLGAVHGTLAALRIMRGAGHGVVVQVGSALAHRSIPLQAPYCAAKAALRGFTDALRCELLHDRSRVRLSMVQLPGLDTPQFDWSRTRVGHRHRPVGRIYRPEVAARAVVDAALRAPRELWVGAPVVQAVLGNLTAPGLLDRLLARRAYDAQFGPPAADADPDVLYAPAARDHGPHGRFGARAASRAWRVNPAVLRGALGLAAAAALLAAAGRRRRRSAREAVGACRGPTRARGTT